jgi:hypothetical protein
MVSTHRVKEIQSLAEECELHVVCLRDERKFRFAYKKYFKHCPAFEDMPACTECVSYFEAKIFLAGYQFSQAI